MQLCVSKQDSSLVQCVAQCSVVQCLMFTGGLMYISVFSRQCRDTGVHAVYWPGSPPVSWWRRPAVRGRLLRNRIGSQHRNIGILVLKEETGKKACVSNQESAKWKKDEPVQQHIARDLDNTVI